MHFTIDFHLVQDNVFFKPVSGCKYCGLENPYIQRQKIQELIEYYVQCYWRQRGFRELDCVESMNRGARKVIYVHLNSLLDETLDIPTQPFFINSLICLFPSTAFQDRKHLPDFLNEGESSNKRKKQVQLLNENTVPIWNESSVKDKDQIIFLIILLSFYILIIEIIIFLFILLCYLSLHLNLLKKSDYSNKKIISPHKIFLLIKS